MISIQEYKRIFETIYSVLKHVGLEPENNCVYFSLVGAVLLKEHFNIECKSYSGIAAYYVNSEINAVLAFAKQTDKGYIASTNGFHSWNQNNDFIVDFTSPLFPEMLMQRYGKKICKRKMFQRKVVEQCQSPKEFNKPGDFYHLPDIEFGKELIGMFANNPMNMDIVTTCNNWFVNPISDMTLSCEVKDENNEREQIRLSEFELTEKW